MLASLEYDSYLGVYYDAEGNKYAGRTCPYCGQLFTSGPCPDGERLSDLAFDMVDRMVGDHINREHQEDEEEQE